jgi:hypothetical protein
VAALLAGEVTHGEVPEALVAACRTHGIPLLAVPSGTSFRSVTDRVYLRLWGDLQARSEGVAAVPEAARNELVALMHAGAPLGDVLARAVTRLGLPECSLVTGGGRVLASSDPEPADRPGRIPSRSTDEPGALPVGPQGDSPFDGWLLQPHAEPGPTASPVLHGLAELLAPSAGRARSTAAAQRQTAARVLELLDRDEPGLSDALTGCGLPERTALTPVTALIEGGPAAWAVTALAEALHLVGAPFVAAPDGRGGATGFAAASPTRVSAALRTAWPHLQRQLTGRQLLRAGVGPSASPRAEALRAALVQAAFARACGVGATVASSAELGSLAALLRGIPAEVTAAFHTRILAPLTAHDQANAVSLLGTLGTFLEHDGSWSRTAEALHIHVNTVHYRIRRIEELTGRSLAKLEDRLDLRAALLCAPPGR